jgi:hypothetical protein
MRKLIINTQLSLDGVMQGPGGPEEDTRGGFEHGGWAMPYFDESMGKASALGMESAGGRTTSSPGTGRTRVTTRRSRASSTRYRSTSPPGRWRSRSNGTTLIS